MGTGKWETEKAGKGMGKGTVSNSHSLSHSRSFNLPLPGSHFPVPDPIGQVLTMIKNRELFQKRSGCSIFSAPTILPPFNDDGVVYAVF